MRLNPKNELGTALFTGMKIKLLSSLFITILLTYSQEQQFLREIDPFTFTESNELQNVFSGGVNNPEFQFVDIDDDEDSDMFILSSDGSFMFYENTGSKSAPSFVLKLNLPDGLTVYDWFYFVDIDNDGDSDIFTGSRGSKISYLENIGTAVSPSFKLQIDTVKNVESKDMIGEVGSNPAFADIDDDGDFDFVSGNQSGSAYFYRNIGTPTSFKFDTLDSKWQNLQVGSGKAIINALHGASSIDFSDIDKDGDLDLFWGDFFNTSLYLIKNNGTAAIPFMQIESKTYPLNGDSISTRGYNMPRLFDIDNDNDLDLFSSVLFNDISLKSTIAFRVNRGSNDFEFVTDDYLNSLDVGSRSVPELVDIDGDNDLDLFIGGESLNDGSIYFYENIGTATQPAFSLITQNYFEITGELSLSPAFGDLDNDGDFDLLVADTFNGINYYENTGDKFTAEFTDRGKLLNSLGDNLNPGVYAKIKLVDAEGDSDLDLISGNFNGEIKFYRNIGTTEDYSYQEDGEYINISIDANYSYATLTDYDNDSINELFVGSDTGILHLYENDSNTNPNFLLNDDSFLKNNFGSEPNIIFGDVDGDNDEDIFIGNIKGGIYFYRNDLISSVKDDEVVRNNFAIKITSFPNPFNSIVHFEISVPKNHYFSFKIFNILGEEVQLLKEGTSAGEVQSITWNTTKVNKELASGVYIATLQTQSGIKSLPIQYLK